MTGLTVLEKILQQIVSETDPVTRSELADRYSNELKLTLRKISDRTQTTLWSEKDDILDQVADTNVLVSRLIDILEKHNSESEEYRIGASIALQAVHTQLIEYINLVPEDERLKLVAQVIDHELRITALENERSNQQT